MLEQYNVKGSSQFETYTIKCMVSGHRGKMGYWGETGKRENRPLQGPKATKLSLADKSQIHACGFHVCRAIHELEVRERFLITSILFVTFSICIVSMTCDFHLQLFLAYAVMLSCYLQSVCSDCGLLLSVTSL